ncbi:MAG: hypothetical protein ACI90M_001009 [Candidatus Azotimanducaceae bacterium]|jgi:hypothetical protein
MRTLALACIALVATTALLPGQLHTEQRRTENVLLVTLDGLRWQDVFGGADNRMMNVTDGGVKDLLATRKRFTRGDKLKNREVLMPFLWQVIAKQGQVFGDPDSNAKATIVNTMKFSYPGYSELICGVVDEAIQSNNKFPNPNINVLEYLNSLQPYRGKVATFASWGVHEYIVNKARSGIMCEVAWQPITVATSAQRQHELQQMVDLLPRYWDNGFSFDALTFGRAKEYLMAKKPRVLYVALGETDEWAHSRRYDLYLQMAQRNDTMIRELWQWLQQDPQYKDKTTLLLTVDHGRGRTPRDWTDHGKNVAGAEEIWMAVMGPDTEALGIRKDVQATQSMIASTVAALLGEDFQKKVPKAAPPLPGVMR